MIGGDWTKVEPMGNGGGKLPAGGYVIRITKAEDVPGKEYLLVEYDVAEGEHAGHYKDLFDRLGFWGGSFVRSYKPKARGFFKSFLDTLEASNNVTLATPNGVDEQKLVGLLCGVVLGEEEYIGNDGTLKTRLKVVTELPVDRIRAGEYTVPEKKKLDPSKIPGGQSQTGTVRDTTAASVVDDFEQINVDLPF